jgi:hypothetical protein
VHINDARSTLQEYLTDMSKAWAVIAVCGFLGGMVLSLGYMVVLRYFAGYMAWLTLLFVNLVFVAFTLLCATRAGLIGDNAVGKVRFIATDSISPLTFPNTGFLPERRRALAGGQECLKVKDSLSLH